MTKDTILGFIRHVLTFAGGWLLSLEAFKDTLTDVDVNTGVGAVMTLIGLGWSAWNKKHKAEA